MNKLLFSRPSFNAFGRATHMLVMFAVLLLSTNALAFNTFEVDDFALPPSNNNTFTRISFKSPFAPGTIPNVFAMTTEDGADPCVVRIKNVDHLGFDAVCLEPINEDRVHPGMVVDYIAIEDGGVTVPLDDGTGDVMFQSACDSIDTQIYKAGVCPGCGPTGYTPINFMPNFGATPAFIAQLQTTENLLPGGDPLFIDVAVETSSIDAAGANITIERLEAGGGPIVFPEKICYLAVERNGCQDLNFSTLGGNATPVTFDAVLGANIVGHGNGCTVTNFTAGCFAGAPITVAGKNSRRGIDGGVLRRCSLNNAGIGLLIDEDRIRDGERFHTTEFVSAFAFGGAFTTPVTFNKARINKFGRKANFSWQTSAESFHLGFHLWGELNGEWIQLNKRLITSNIKHQNGARDYQHSLRLSRKQADKISNFGISSVDNSGYEEFYGPFTVDVDYGEQALNEAVDWTATRTEFEQSMQARGFTQYRGRWRRLSNKRSAFAERKQLNIDKNVLSMTVSQAGIQRLSFEQIKAIMPDWEGIKIKRLTLALNGKSLPRHIISDDSIFNAGDSIFFVGQLPNAGDDTYLDTYRYQLYLNSNTAIAAATPEQDVPPSTSGSRYGLVTDTLSELKEYSALLNNGNPWYDARLFSVGNPASKEYTFDLADDFDKTSPSKLALNLFGGIDFPALEANSPDHHVQVKINNTLVADTSFDGFIENKLEIELPANALQAGTNSISITLPGDTGYVADVILIDTLQITIAKLLSEQTNTDFAAIEAHSHYQVAVDSPVSSYQIFAYRADGALSVITENQSAATVDDELLLSFSANVHQHSSSAASAVRYAVGQLDSWHQPSELESSLPSILHEDKADYLIVSHPSFIGPALEQFALQKKDMGYNSQIVDWLEIVDTYGYGNNTPAALNNFLKLSARHSDISHVLIVGGHTYDYRNISGSNTLNFIPAHYKPVSIFGHTPTDNPFADLDNDHLPDIAIGRWPVRSLQDLNTILKKNNDWQSNIASQQYQDAYLIAQANDGQGLDFAEQTQGRLGLPLNQNQDFDQITVLSMQQLIDQGVPDPIGVARAQIAERINSGVNLLSFAGHASTSAWGSPGIVNTSFIQALENSGKPTIVMPLACYTTYYESLGTNSLAHQWLFAGDKGAAAIHGASVLGDYRENAVFAERYLKNLPDAKTIGEAIMNAKREMAGTNQMLDNWALLGDPSLPVR